MEYDNKFLGWWALAVAILVVYAVWLDEPRAPICASDARWPCPEKGAGQ